MAQSSNNTISALEDRMDSVLCKLFDKINAMEKRQNASSLLLSHTMEKLHLKEEELKRQTSQIASLKKKLKEAIWLNNLTMN